MTKINLLLSIFFCLHFFVSKAQIINPGFETGNCTGWTLNLGQAAGATQTISGTVYNIPSTIVAGACNDAQHLIVTAGNDATVPALPKVHSGAYSIKIGDDDPGYDSPIISQTFNVTPSNTTIKVYHAVVLEDGAHAANEQPYFRINFKDSSGTAIPGLQYMATAGSGGDPSFILSGAYNYKPWTSYDASLQAYVGQNVTLEITVSDCDQGGHGGHAYIDVETGSGSGTGICNLNGTINSTTDTLCNNSSTHFSLDSITGVYNFNWSGPAGYTGPTTQNDITTNVPGYYYIDYYNVNVNPTTCLYRDSILITDNTPHPIIDNSTNVCIENGAVTLNGGPSGGHWVGAGITDTVNGILDPVISGTGTFSIKYFINNNGCVNSDTMTVHVDSCTSAACNFEGVIASNASIICNNSTVVINIDSISGTYNYAWTAPAAYTGPINQNSVNTSVPGWYYVDYYNVNINPTTCLYRDSIFISAFTSQPIIDNTTNVCIENGNVTLNGGPTGGYWAGAGITDSINGILDPVISGLGIFSIKYYLDNNGCVNSDTMTVYVDSCTSTACNLNGVIVSNANNICNNSNVIIHLDSISAASYNYNWTAPIGYSGAVNQNGVTTNTAGWYYVDYYNLNINPTTCIYRDSILVNAYSSMPVIDDSTTACSNAGLITLNGGPSGGIWSGVGITDANNGIFSTNVSGIGVFAIKYTLNVSGCVNSDTMYVNVDACTGINEQLANNIIIQSNQDNVLELLQQNNFYTKYVIYDVLGKVISETTISENNILINKTGLSSGLYFIKFSNSKQQQILRVVKN